MKIVVASKNPVKIKAVETGFRKIFPSEELKVEGLAVPSGVRDQPMDDHTTFLGASNRASNVKVVSKADFYVGIEGGIERQGDEMQAFAWVVIKSNEMTGKAKTGTFFLPQAVVKLINSGKELGEADDMVFGHTNSKQKNGAVGILTGGVIDRTSLYAEAVILALIPFKNPQIFTGSGIR